MMIRGNKLKIFKNIDFIYIYKINNKVISNVKQNST